MTAFAPPLSSPSTESSSDDANKYLMVGRTCGAQDDDAAANLLFGRPGLNAADTSGNASTAMADNSATRKSECEADLAIVKFSKGAIVVGVGVLNAETLSSTPRD